MSNKKNKRKAVLEQNKKKGISPIAAGIIAVLTAVIAVMIFNTAGGGQKENASQQATGQISQSNFSSSPSSPSSPSSSGGSDFEEVEAVDGLVSLPVSLFDDGSAKYFTYAGSSNINFFVLKSSDGVIRAAFDTCDVCYAAKRGYRQEGDLMVCNNCGQQFPSVRINVEKGGCNPAPLNRVVEGDKLVISVADIQTGARYF